MRLVVRCALLLMLLLTGCYTIPAVDLSVLANRYPFTGRWQGWDQRGNCLLQLDEPYAWSLHSHFKSYQGSFTVSGDTVRFPDLARRIQSFRFDCDGHRLTFTPLDTNRTGFSQLLLREWRFDPGARFDPTQIIGY